MIHANVNVDLIIVFAIECVCGTFLFSSRVARENSNARITVCRSENLAWSFGEDDHNCSVIFSATAIVGLLM